jgi:hypothetical protein
MLKLYARLAGKAIRLSLRGWPAAVVLPLYATLLQLAGGLLGPIGGGGGMIGGLLLWIVVAFLASSYLTLVSLAVAGRKIGLGDFRQSFLAHFGDVISVMFATWVIQLVASVVARSFGDRGTIIFVLVDLTMVVFFNPIPEMIYLGGGRTRSFGLLMEAARFITAHWPEWLAPSIVIAAVLLAPTGLIQHGPLAMRLLAFQSLFSLDGLTATVNRIPLLLKPLMLIFLNWAMVFRGLLFTELTLRVRRPRPWP